MFYYQFWRPLSSWDALYVESLYQQSEEGMRGENSSHYKTGVSQQYCSCWHIHLQIITEPWLTSACIHVFPCILCVSDVCSLCSTCVRLQRPWRHEAWMSSSWYWSSTMTFQTTMRTTCTDAGKLFFVWTHETAGMYSVGAIIITVVRSDLWGL